MKGKIELLKLAALAVCLLVFCSFPELGLSRQIDNEDVAPKWQEKTESGDRVVGTWSTKLGSEKQLGELTVNGLRELARETDFRHKQTIRACLLIVSFILVVGLLKLCLHLNHITHGNYAGRLQFFGGLVAIAILAGCVSMLVYYQSSPCWSVTQIESFINQLPK